MDIRTRTTGLLLIMWQMYYSDFFIHHYEVFGGGQRKQQIEPGKAQIYIYIYYERTTARVCVGVV